MRIIAVVARLRNTHSAVGSFGEYFGRNMDKVAAHLAGRAGNRTLDFVFVALTPFLQPLLGRFLRALRQGAFARINLEHMSWQS